MKARLILVWIAFVLFIPFGLILASCAGRGGEAENQGEIKIGAPLPLTGPYASDGEQMLKALQMAVDEQNAKGGLLGRPLKLLVGDVGALEAEKIRAEGTKFIAEKVDAVITGYADNGEDVRFFGEYEIPFLHANATTMATELVAQDRQKYGNVFQYCPSEIAYGFDAASNLFRIGRSMGWQEPNKNIAMIKLNDRYNLIAAEKFAELARAQGYEIVVNELVEMGPIEDWKPILAKIEQTHPAYVIFWDFEPDHASRFMVQFAERFLVRGLNALLFMQYTPAFPAFMEVAASAAEGLLWTSTLNPVGAGVEDYKRRWIAKYGEEPQAIYAYVTRDGFDIWVRAVEKAGCVDCYDKVIETIRTTSHPGLAGVHVFAASDQQSKYGVEYIPTLWYQVWGGQHRVVAPARFQQVQPQLPPWVK